MAGKRKVAAPVPFEEKNPETKSRSISRCSKCGPISIEHKNAIGHENALRNLHSLAKSKKQAALVQMFTKYVDGMSEELSESQLEELKALDRCEAHAGKGWHTFELFKCAMYCPGRVLVLILLELARERSPFAELTTSALFKWASMIANGKQADLLHLPPQVQARAQKEAWSDDELPPTSRAVKKNKPQLEMQSPPPQAIVGLPSPSAAQLVSWMAPGAARRTVLPAAKDGDADQNAWLEAEIEVTVPHLVPVYELLQQMTAVFDHDDSEEEMVWCAVPVPRALVSAQYKMLAEVAASPDTPLKGKLSNSQSGGQPKLVVRYVLPSKLTHDFLNKVGRIINPDSGGLTKEALEILSAASISADVQKKFEEKKICNITALQDIVVLPLADLQTEGVPISLLEFARLKKALSSLPSAAARPSPAMFGSEEN